MVVSVFWSSLNGNFLLSPPRATYLPTERYVYTGQSIGMPKSLNSGSGSKIGLGHNPTISPNQGNTLSLHLIYEDSETHSKHNINIDEFDVHSKDLGYFQSQTITFTANKTGTFDYYCSIHPEMTGKIMVKSHAEAYKYWIISMIVQLWIVKETTYSLL